MAKGHYPVAITDENEMMDILENSRCITLFDVKFNIADREKMDNDVLSLVRRFPVLWRERDEWDEGDDYWVYSHLSLIVEEDEDEGLFWFVDMDEELSNFGCSFYEFAKILAKYAKPGSVIPLKTEDYGKAQAILEDGKLSLWAQHDYKQ